MDFVNLGTPRPLLGNSSELEIGSPIRSYLTLKRDPNPGGVDVLTSLNRTQSKPSFVSHCAQSTSWKRDKLPNILARQGTEGPTMEKKTLKPEGGTPVSNVGLKDEDRKRDISKAKDIGGSSTVQVAVKKEENLDESFGVKQEVKTEEKVKDEVKKEEDVKEEGVAALGVVKNEPKKENENEDGEFDEDEDALASMAREGHLSDFEDEVRYEIMDITMEIKRGEDIVGKEVRAPHSKACERCGYNSWRIGEMYYSSSGPWWAGTNRKFCKSCYRAWLREDLSDYEATDGLKSMRDELVRIDEWREANNCPR